MTWRRAAIGPAVYQHAMAFDPLPGVTVLHGGRRADGRPVNGTWEYDGAQWRQISTTSVPTPTFGHAMAWDAALRRIVLFGGSNGPNLVDNHTWAYDGSGWTSLDPPRPVGRYLHSGAFDPIRRRFMLVG